ncbi:LLM class flavin-dependent oxidoreductase [Aneurinibacillus tyrosinisolvens]|uniref:LLM class flavin-dependent oxidoreductase n=1 Tax=Aneurinibacillus tyrosinisolvens TaxID=1443435 RepID=UPI00063FC8E9|nr:LLM class flavin-dependent oxidoreductase [Aneurinibacillus tyrosinisolvens]
MKISILDQSPISNGSSPAEALAQTARLLQRAEQLGYTRYWVAEHHGMTSLANPSPEVLLGRLGALTSTIRIGSGAVLLPHYSPYKVAENFNLLSTLYPGRIDLGIGRAPGGSAHETLALRENYLQNVHRLPSLLSDLIGYLYDELPADHPFAGIHARPLPPVPPEIWLLGTSGKSAKYAAELGASFAFGHFMSESDGPAILQEYRQNFQPSRIQQKPKTIVTVSAICAETEEEASRLAASLDLWGIKTDQGTAHLGIPSVEEALAYPYTEAERQAIRSKRQNMLIGTKEQMKEQVHTLQQAYQADEWMFVTITHDYEARLRSYKLLADVFLSKG